MTEDKLLQAAGRQGFAVTAAQLKRWRRAGLIPRPAQEHVPGQLGSNSSYPPGTLAQLLAVASMRERFKSLERVRFQLWWAGQYNSDLDPVRQCMVRRLDRLLTPVRELRDRYDDPLEAAEAAVRGDELVSRRPVFRAMRRFAKTDENLRSAAIAILCDLFGGEVTWESPDTGLDEPEPSLQELVETIIGAQRAKIDRTDSAQPLLAPGADVLASIRLMNHSGVIDLDHPGSAIASATDADFNEAAVRARLLLEGLSLVARVSAVRYGRDYAGLSVLAGFDASDPTLIAFAMQLRLHLPSLTQTGEEHEHLTGVLSAIEQNLDSLRCINIFCDEHPGYAFIFKDDSSMRLQALNRDERGLLTLTIDEFLKRHPECAALVTDTK